MRRYNITVGAKTTAGGEVISGLERTSFNGRMIAREGDRVACPACGTEGVIALTGPHLHEDWGGKQAALEGDLCMCKCDPPPTLIANQHSKSQDFDPQPQRDAFTWTGPNTPNPPVSHFSNPGAMNRTADACVFAKSCVSVPVGPRLREQALNTPGTLAPLPSWRRPALPVLSGGSQEHLVATSVPGPYAAGWPEPVRHSMSCCWPSGHGISVIQRCTPRSSWRV